MVKAVAAGKVPPDFGQGSARQTPSTASGRVVRGIPRRLRGQDSMQPKRIPAAGLVPATHVFGSEIIAASRRGCPERAEDEPGQGALGAKFSAKSPREFPWSFSPHNPARAGEGGATASLGEAKKRL